MSDEIGEIIDAFLDYMSRKDIYLARCPTKFMDDSEALEEDREMELIKEFVEYRNSER